MTSRYRDARKHNAQSLLKWELDLQRREAQLQRPQPDMFRKGFEAGMKAGRATAADTGDSSGEQPGDLSTQLKTILGDSHG
jgi:hypothetical protein